ncbi:MAG: GGDEF domain-containing protein [Firmicutes bacterium]|nr:GGDEF domain-containing protein [Bacillota bacterium]
MEATHLYDLTKIICKGIRGLLYLATLIWIIWFIRTHHHRIQKAVWLFIAGLFLLLTGLVIEFLGKYYSLSRPFKEIVGDIILNNAGTALILGALLLLVAEVSRVSRQHQREAETDPLTELFNRRVFFAEAERVLAEARAGNGSPVVAVLDVDNMKEINDTLGHQCGDGALKHVARAIQMSIREGDVAIRYGGDEFAILFPNKGPHLKTLQERLQKYMKVTCPDKDIFLSLSIGLARYPEDGKSLDELISVADARMYAAKKAKGSCRN